MRGRGGIPKRNGQRKGRNILIVEEGLEKIKVKLQKLEEKLVKGNSSKLSKGEKSLMNDLEVDVSMLKEKTNSMETTLNHLNEVNYEDFIKRFKKELIESTDTHFSKVSKEIKIFEEGTETQKRTNENIQRSLVELRKKLTWSP